MDETLLASRRLYEGKVVSLRLDTLKLADGHVTEREVVEHTAAVAILPLTAAGAIVMVRQHRRPAGKDLLELPAGSVDPGETPEACAGRELQEETGLRAALLTRIGGFWVAPGYSTEYIHLYRAEGLSEERLDADADERIEVETLTLAAALDQLDSGAIEDSKTIIGLLLHARYVERSSRRDHLAP